VYWERIIDRFEAAKREKQIKRMGHKEKEIMVVELISTFKYKS